MRKCAGLVLAQGSSQSDSSAAQQFVRRGGRQTPNHTLQRPAASRSCSNPRVSWPPSLSLGRYITRITPTHFAGIGQWNAQGAE